MGFLSAVFCCRKRREEMFRKICSNVVQVIFMGHEIWIIENGIDSRSLVKKVEDFVWTH